MIERLSANEFRLSTRAGEIDRTFAPADLEAHLRGIIHEGERLWSDDNIARIMAFEVGQETILPWGEPGKK